MRRATQNPFQKDKTGLITQKNSARATKFYEFHERVIKIELFLLLFKPFSRPHPVRRSRLNVVLNFRENVCLFYDFLNDVKHSKRGMQNIITSL